MSSGALKDAVASTGGLAAALTDSQLGSLSEALINAKYSFGRFSSHPDTQARIKNMTDRCKKDGFQQ